MKPLRPQPPRLAQRFLCWFLRDDLAEEVEGDLEEAFYERLAQTSLFRARLRYWYQVFTYLRPFAIRNSLFTPSTPSAMYQSYFKVGWRNLFRHKGYSFINVGGLAVGMAVALLIGLWSWDEWSFNQHFTHYDRIARVMQNHTFNGEIHTWNSVPMQLGPALREEYGSDFTHVVRSSWTEGHTLAHGETRLTQRGNFMEPGAPDLLSLQMRSGTRNGLADPHSILLSASVAQAFFGEEDPLGQLMQLDNQLDVTVTGVYEDLPASTDFAGVGFITPWKLLEPSLPEWIGWGNSWFQTFVQVADPANLQTVSAKIKNLKRNHVDAEEARYEPEVFLHPMRRWHLYNDFKNGVNTGGMIHFVWLFGIIGVFVLLLACINFMNLSTARSERRAKEVGIRKAIGSVRSQLIAQFFSESLLIVLLAFVLALPLVVLVLPGFNQIADKHLSLPWANGYFWALSLGFIVLTGLLAGSYPALFLSSFNPVRVLKGAGWLGTLHGGRFAALPRKALVVVQFTVSVTLIIGTLIVFRQIQFAKNRPLGYDDDGLIQVPIKTDDIHQHYQALRDELLQTGVVDEVAKTDVSVTSTYVTNSGFTWAGKDPNMTDEFVTLRMTPEFGKMIGWQVLEGRDFSADVPSDTAAFLLNEAAVAYMGLEHPVGEAVRWGDNGTYTVIGVVKNLVTQSPYAPIRPMIFINNPDWTSLVNVKLTPQARPHEALSSLETVFKKYDPVNPFEYQFADEEYAKKFGNEERIGTLASLFAGLAILISCLGLFGLAAYAAERRTKEIGIRKVLGASVSHLWQLLSTDFVGLVLIACLIATPLAYYFLHEWLQGYEYRTELSWWIFAVAGAGALVITLLTVSYQTIKAALVNPVNSLRNE
ncbi:ABC-type antimicrobial peptide transport system, permease component [Catalinimonas alkaloidigena]|uniref:ABC-type antimicrobial peptide transport system, permease component n=1 Tax=Catalinimonas alkaloidigena TaxID=1075417 RepID=A0A1G9IKY1_9BACT|nr:ABC transporter permease [Catalinimonas alkaloidigena]SDL25524.1 ABC-type antimicrobial peptide transport system, permease component [Catalinimonas alkaloidigena]